MGVVFVRLDNVRVHLLVPTATHVFHIPDNMVLPQLANAQVTDLAPAAVYVTKEFAHVRRARMATNALTACAYAEILTRVQ